MWSSVLTDIEITFSLGFMSNYKFTIDGKWYVVIRHWLHGNVIVYTVFSRSNRARHDNNTLICFLSILNNKESVFNQNYPPANVMNSQLWYYYVSVVYYIFDQDKCTFSQTFSDVTTYSGDCYIDGCCLDKMGNVDNLRVFIKISSSF